MNGMEFPFHQLIWELNIILHLIHFKLGRFTFNLLTTTFMPNLQPKYLYNEDIWDGANFSCDLANHTTVIFLLGPICSPWFGYKIVWLGYLIYMPLFFLSFSIFGPYKSHVFKTIMSIMVKVYHKPII